MESPKAPPDHADRRADPAPGPSDPRSVWLVTDELIDTGRYPVTDVDSPKACDVIAFHAEQLRRRGVSVLPGFIRPEAIASMVEECDALADQSHHQDTQGTPYLELPSD